MKYSLKSKADNSLRLIRLLLINSHVIDLFDSEKNIDI